VRRTIANSPKARYGLGSLVCALAVCLLAMAGFAYAANVDALHAKIDRAESQAGAIAEELRVTQDRLVAAEQRSVTAGAREQELSGLLATGQARAARLEGRVSKSKQQLIAERRRLRRARHVLAGRLVAIYMVGAPSEASVILGASDFADLTTRTEYMERIEESDTQLAVRVEQVRKAVQGRLRQVAALKERADAYNEKLTVAHSQIAAVRSSADAAAAELQSISSSREASLSALKSRIGSWVTEVEEAEAASRAAAEETVGRWLGGPYSIPTYIVMCESGGNYGALNPSSGAGGAYQILPSTWALYGGQGAPQAAPKAEQDRIAAEIWADSGGGAWVCAG
jgi:septal ring factor EnvC (AmiA/AmiB activator)